MTLPLPLPTPRPKPGKASVPASAPKVEIWTDGGCRPNPGKGGWGVVLVSNGIERELSGAEAVSTNNRMELTAAAMALEALTEPSRVVLHTDSEYLRNGITKWVAGWIKKGWRTASGDPVKNVDLWQRLMAAEAHHHVEFKWVKAHNNGADMRNERCDALCTAALESL